MAIFALAFGLGAVAIVAGAFQLVELKNRERTTALIAADLEATLDKISGGPAELVEARALALVLARSARSDDPRRYGLLRDGRLVAGHEGPFSSQAVRRAVTPTLELVVDRVDGAASIDREMVGVIVIATLFAAIGAFVVGPLASRGLLARVDAINRACDEVRSGALSARAPGAEIDDEFGALSRHVNGMLERIDELMVGLRDLSNRVAHDLRTPMARLKADLEAISRAASLEEARERAALAAVETDDLLQTFESLLDIVEAEAGADTGFKPLDLGDAIKAAVDLYAPVAEDRGVILQFEPSPAPVLAERLLLVRLAANLIDNAIKFSPAGGVIRVRIRWVRHTVTLTVSDEGPGVPDAEKDIVLRRFVRGSSVAASTGHGLGLALVAAVAKRHGAVLSLKDNNPGLRVELHIPAFERR